MHSSSVASSLDSLHELPLRRIPRQRRSRRRVADMISAAIDLLVLGGTEAVTTSAVAEKAGVPIGSVYQFFPDRGTLLLAVAEVSSRPLQETAQLIKADSITRAELDSWLSKSETHTVVFFDATYCGKEALAQHVITSGQEKH